MPNILIVDDDGETCRFMSELLDGPGRTIHTASQPDTTRRRPLQVRLLRVLEEGEIRPVGGTGTISERDGSHAGAAVRPGHFGQSPTCRPR